MEANKDKPVKRRKNGQFETGCSGNYAGKPLGTKHAISKEFREKSYQAFLELGGVEWIKKVAQTKKNAASVLNFFSKLMPKDINIESEKPIPVLIIDEAEDEGDVVLGPVQPLSGEPEDKDE